LIVLLDVPKARTVIPYDAAKPTLAILVLAYLFVSVLIFALRSLAPNELKRAGFRACTFRQTERASILRFEYGEK
jgi:hypothetical protein